MDYSEKLNQIKKEKAKINKIFKDLDANTKIVVQPLIDRLSFITVSLRELEDDLALTGWTEEYQNGPDQCGIKKSVSADLHINLTKNLNALTKQLIDIVPKAQRKSKLAEMKAR